MLFDGGAEAEQLTLSTDAFALVIKQNIKATKTKILFIRKSPFYFFDVIVFDDKRILLLLLLSNLF